MVPRGQWLVASFMFLLTIAASYLAVATFSRELSRDAIVALQQRGVVDGELLEDAIDAAEFELRRVPWSDRATTNVGILELARLNQAHSGEAIKVDRHAAEILTSGIRKAPNGRGAWRALIAATYRSEGPSERLIEIAEGAMLLDAGSASTLMTLAAIAVAHPDLFPDDLQRDILRAVPRIHAIRSMWDRLGRFYARLGDQQKALLLSEVDDPDYFILWADYQSEQQGW